MTYKEARKLVKELLKEGSFDDAYEQLIDPYQRNAGWEVDAARSAGKRVVEEVKYINYDRSGALYI